MGSTGTAKAAGGASGSGEKIPRGYRKATASEKRASKRATGSAAKYVYTGKGSRKTAATPVRKVQSGRVSAREFERATGVNPRTGKRKKK